MDTLLPIEQFQAFLIVMSRVAGFVGAVPVFSSAQTPNQIKTGLAVMLSLLMFPIMEPQIGPISLEPITFGLLIVSEVLLGLLLGLVARLIFTAVEFGATVIGFQMGFAAANVFDPQNQRQVALISQFQNVFSILIFLAINGHYLFLQTAVRSYELLPPGKLNLAGDAIPYLMELSSHMFALGVQFSAPVLTVLLLSGLILGILARVFPQLNVFLISFPINIGTAFIVIALTLPLVSMLLRREFDSLVERFSTLLNYLSI
ncbi:flagellar biosynthetic protein FliR [Desulforhopalus sp. 52FAK]